MEFHASIWKEMEQSTSKYAKQSGGNRKYLINKHIEDYFQFQIHTVC